MKQIKTPFFLGMTLLLSACATDGNAPWPTGVAASQYQIRFDFPAEEHWELAGQTQDNAGYSRSWRPVTAKGTAAAQSLYVNFGRGVMTPLNDAMREVEQSMRSAGCKKIERHVWERAQQSLTFTVVARQCQQGRPVWQVFHVLNRSDGQYALVYSANPDTVPVATRQQMAQTVELSTLVPGPRAR